MVVMRQLVHQRGFLEVGAVIDADFVIGASSQNGLARDGGEKC